MFVLYFFTLSLLVAYTYATAGCPTGYTAGPDAVACYKVSDALATWGDGEKACALDGGHLASIPDAFTNSFLVNLFRGSSLAQANWDWAYIGGIYLPANIG